MQQQKLRISYTATVLVYSTGQGCMGTRGRLLAWLDLPDETSFSYVRTSTSTCTIRAKEEPIFQVPSLRTLRSQFHIFP